MKQGSLRERWKAWGLTALLVTALWLFLSVFFDFYYDLNDDWAMKDILSGAYTGSPDGHNVQMLYPLGFIIALGYRVCGVLPWYGIFLCCCQFFALGIIVHKLTQQITGWRGQNVLRVFLLAAVSILFLYEFIFIQYTVTAGLLTAAAMVWILASPDADAAGFLRYHAVTVFLALLAFGLRTEMMLLLSPFLGLAFLWRFAGKKGQIWRAALPMLGILLGMGILLAADGFAYSSPEWKAFRSFFDDRTQVYDFYGVPDYENNQELYQTLGLPKSAYVLLENYNFDLDDDIDSQMMHGIADYAAQHQETGTGRRLYLALYTYVYRFLHGQELLLDLFCLVCYFFLIRTAFYAKNRRLFLYVMLTFSLRSMLWLFLLYRGRVPERITHPLYLTELLFLGAFVFLDKNGLQWKKYEKSAILSLYVILLLCGAVFNGQSVSRTYAQRESVNENWLQWKAYCAKRPEQYYCMDVYSTVAYSEKLFSNTSSAYRNFDLAGGWSVKSPLAEEKRGRASVETMEKALLTPTVFFVADAKKEERNPSFLVPYYRDRDVEITIEEADRCGSFAIYRLKTITDKETGM